MRPIVASGEAPDGGPRQPLAGRICERGDEHYKGRQAADLAGLSPARISDLFAKGEFPGEKVHGELRISCEPFQAWLRARLARLELRTLADLEREYGYAAKTVKRAIKMGQLRVRERREWERGHGTVVLLDRAEFLEDLAALPACRMPRCEATVPLGSDYCREHYHVPGLERAATARRANRDQTHYTGVEAARLAGVSGAKISEAARREAFPSEKAHGELRIPREPFHAWLREYKARKPHWRPRPTLEELVKLKRRAVELWHAGYDENQIARELGRARNTVCGYLEQNGIDRPRRRSARKLSRDERDQLAERAKELCEADVSVAQIGIELGVSRTQLLRLLQLPTAEGREESVHVCVHCLEPFTPRIPAPRHPEFAPQRFCSVQCAREEPSEAYQAALQAKGLVGVPEAARRLRISAARVRSHLNEGTLDGERVTYAGQVRPGWGVSEAEIARFKHAWVKPDNGHRNRWLNPDVAVAQLRAIGHLEAKARKLGLSVAEMEAIERDRFAQRAKDYRCHRRGRKPAAGPPEHYLRWQALYAELEAELLATWEQDVENGIASASDRPGRMAVCRTVALQDWQEHPEHWPRDRWRASAEDPDALEEASMRDAGTTVLNGLKALQKALKQIPAT